MAYTTIDKPTNFFNPKLHTGNSSTQSITGVGFQPDWTWIKGRASAYSHNVYDSVRGVTKILRTNSTGGEGTQSTSLTAFGTDGFTLGSYDESNYNSQTYVSWNWKAGTSVSGDTGGSGTAKTYTGSVNTTSGFSIIKYTGNGTAGHTIPHRLGVVPKMFIVKSPSIADDGWFVYNGSLGATKNFRMEATGAVGTSNVYWNDTEPTSSVFTLGSSGGTNQNGSTYIAYIFAEVQSYSKFGSYVGNGNADGTFVYTGFKPAWVMAKQSSAAGEGWYMWDNKRDAFNVATKFLTINTSAAEGSGVDTDMLSNGFKLRYSGAASNSSGATYIYWAFAENPFVTSTDNGSIPATAR